MCIRIAPRQRDRNAKRSRITNVRHNRIINDDPAQPAPAISLLAFPLADISTMGSPTFLVARPSPCGKRGSRAWTALVNDCLRMFEHGVDIRPRRRERVSSCGVGPTALDVVFQEQHETARFRQPRLGTAALSRGGFPRGPRHLCPCHFLYRHDCPAGVAGDKSSMIVLEE